MVLHNSARGDTYLLRAELTAASPRTVSLEHFLNLYDVLDNLLFPTAYVFLLIYILT
jgi:hypothetical protein